MMASTVNFQMSFDAPEQAAVFFQHLANAYAAVVKLIDPRSPAAIGLPSNTPAADFPKTSGANAGTTAPSVETPAEETKRGRGRPKSTGESREIAGVKSNTTVEQPAEKAPELNAIEQVLGAGAPEKEVTVDQLRKIGSQVINAKGLGATVVKKVLDTFGAQKYADVAEEKRGACFHEFAAQLKQAGFEPEIPF